MSPSNTFSLPVFTTTESRFPRRGGRWNWTFTLILRFQSEILVDRTFHKLHTRYTSFVEPDEKLSYNINYSYFWEDQVFELKDTPLVPVSWTLRELLILERLLIPLFSRPGKHGRLCRTTVFPTDLVHHNLFFSLLRRPYSPYFLCALGPTTEPWLTVQK